MRWAPAHNQRMKLTGAAILVSRGMKVLQAAPAAYPYRLAARGRPMRPEVAKYQPQLDVLVSFAEGRLDGPALDAALATEEMKTLLGVFEDPRYPALTNHCR